MNSRDDVQYRLDLSKGFLNEAKEDFELKRWRSCVDNAQLSVENSGKAILMLFGVTLKSHEPAKQLSQLVHESKIPKTIRDRMKDILPDFLTLGVEEHFMTDYGDESTYTLPWELFDEQSANKALRAAKKCQTLSEEIVNDVHQWRSAGEKNGAK